MRKICMRVVMALVALVSCSVASAQMSAELPVDSAVRIGRLDNGLTYYIRHNETPKGQADFYIAQKVGSILEDDNQRGLAHFLEHMCFNGTKNFPEKGIINWLESVGVKFGYNLNAQTGVDETIYNISSVPTARTSVQDSCLLILHDWACDLTLDPKEIDAERGVIHEEWRMSNQGSMRIIEQLLPTIYPGTKYGYRLPIGTMEVVDNFPYQALIDYYHKWYRPDQQGIIVVGDIDVDYIEGKIKEYFSPIKMPENPAERIYEAVPDTPGTIYAIGSDKEMQAPVFMLMFKSDVLPMEQRNTIIYYAQQYVETMIDAMLNERFSEMMRKPDCPFAQAQADFDQFFLAKTKDAFTVQGVGKKGDMAQAYEAIYREIQRVARNGFSQTEYDRAKAEYLSRMERLYNERNNTPNESYVHEYVRNFTDGEPIPGIDIDYQIAQQLAQMIQLPMINAAFTETISEGNRVLLVMMPEGEGYTTPTEAQLAAITDAVNAETLEDYAGSQKDEPLIPALPAPGKIVSEKYLEQWEATELTLSNGVKVIVKPTTFKDNEIRFDAMAKGGTSVVSADKAPTMRFFQYGSGLHGINNYNSGDLEKYTKGKQVSINLSMDTYDRGVSGVTTVKDLPTEMELIYGTFTGYHIDADEFEAAKQMFKGALANQVNSPQYVFQRDLMKTLFESPNMHALELSDLDEASAQDTEAVMKQMLANAADYTFVFTGKIDMDTFRPLVEQYIATLPADASKAVDTIEYNPAFEIAKGDKTTTYSTTMETPMSWVFIGVSGNMDYTPAQRELSTIAAQIISKRLLNKIREEMGAVYSIGMQGAMTRTGATNVILQSAFPTKPEMKEETLAAIKEIIVDAANNIGDDELAPVKEFMVKEVKDNLEKNEAWSGAIAATSLNGVDVFNGRIDTINGITTDDVKKYMRDLLQQNNYQVVVLDPVAAAAE